MRRLLLILAVLALASCSNTCGGPASSGVPAPSTTPSKTSTPVYPDSSCKTEAQSHSLNSNTATSYTITNHLVTTVTLFWLNFEGKRVKYFDLAAGETKDQATFITHPWVVADQQGGCLLLFLVTDPVHITVG